MTSSIKTKKISRTKTYRITNYKKYRIIKYYSQENNNQVGNKWAYMKNKIPFQILHQIGVLNVYIPQNAPIPNL
jgi:hypothetical protein